MSGVQELSVASHPAEDALSVFRAVADRLKATFGGSQQSLCKSPQEARIGTTCTPPSSPSGKGMCSSSLDSSFNVNAAVPFRRCYSGSTGLPDLPHECDLEDDWDEHDLSGSPSMSWPHEDVLEQKLTEVKELYRHRFGVDLDEDSDSVSSTAEFECDTDGTPWTKIEGTGTLTFAKLEAELEAAKCLFQAKYAETFSDCDSEPASESENASMGEGIEEKEVRDADGTLWLKTQGTGPLTLSKLEQDLPEVKSLYAAAFGQDVDDEDTDQQELDSDGTLWLKTQGTGPLTLSKLEQDLLEVKSLYATAFGQDVDDEDADQQPSAS